jgi:hypothetical protein
MSWHQILFISKYLWNAGYETWHNVAVSQSVLVFCTFLPILWKLIWISLGVCVCVYTTYAGASKSSRTGRLEGELQIVQLSATKCSCIAILWVSLVSFAAITPCVAFQRVFVYFVIDSVWKLLDTSSCVDCKEYDVYRITCWISTGNTETVGTK